MKRILLATAVSAALTLTACSPGNVPAEPDTHSATTSTGAEPTAVEPTSTEPTGEPTSAATTRPADSSFTTGPTSSADFPELVGQFLPESVRVGGHQAFDRVVVEYAGNEGFLNWSAAYEETPTHDGSGFAVDLEGEAFLEIWVSGVVYPDEADMEDYGEFPPTGMNQSTMIKDVQVDAPFEGMHKVFIGLDKVRPYKIQVLDLPTRLVIDIEK